MINFVLTNQIFFALNKIRMNPKLLYSALAAIVVAVEEGARNLLRSNGQKKLQERVNAAAPTTPIKKDLGVEDDHIQLAILKKSNIDLVHCQELPMDENEKNEWKTLISTLGSESIKTVLNTSAFNGLLKCDAPLKDLCRIKDNPDAMRGFIMTDGKFSKHASFSEIGLSNVAPLLVYQCMAAVTSQYYQQIITERLNAIDIKLDNIIKILTADDRAKLKVAYNRFIELNKKSTYDIADKQIVSEFSGYVEIVREKYRELLSGIVNLNASYKWSDKEEAKLKIQCLQKSHYFDYLDMVMHAEVLTFIASVISIKVAKFLGNHEDIKIYADRINLDYWNNYVDQFYKIRHDVVKYLEFEADASWIQGESIVAMKNEQLKKFKDIEESMKKLQSQFNHKTTQYIEIHEDGTLKKYIHLAAS